MPRSANRAAGNVKNENAAVWMLQFFNFNPKLKRSKNASLDGTSIRKRLGANDTPRRFIADTQHQMAATFVRERHAILEQLVNIVLLLRFLEFQMLGFRCAGQPAVNLLKCGHAAIFSSIVSASGRRNWPEIRRGRSVSRRLTRVCACNKLFLIFAIQASIVRSNALITAT